MACRRCLNDAGASVTSDEHVIFVEADDEEADNPDVVPLDPRAEEIDLRPAVREQWLLNVPAFALCRDDCKGLCATCGADLNAGPCSCLTQHAVDPRWDVLRKLGSSLTEDERATGRSGTSRTSAKQKRKN